MIVDRVFTLPGIHSYLRSVSDLASYAQSGVENGVDGMDFDILEEKCCAAYELLSPSVSEIGEAMTCLDPGSWFDPPLDSDIRKSTEVLRDTVELFHLSASEFEELEKLMQDPQPSPTVCDRLQYGFYSLEELGEVIEHLQNDISFYRKCRSACLQPITEHLESNQELEPTHDQPTFHSNDNSTDSSISIPESQKSQLSPNQQRQIVTNSKPFPTLTLLSILTVSIVLNNFLLY